MLKKSSLVFCLIALGCGKAPEMKEPYQGRTIHDLTGKTSQDIAKLKYNNRISLYCSIKASTGQILSYNSKPVDEFFWDLPHDLNQLHMLNYKIGTKAVTVIVRLTENMDFRPQLTHIGRNRTEYFMENTPVQKIYYKRASKTTLRDGSVHERSTFSETTLFENVETRLFSMTTETEDGFISEEVNCKLQTQAFPEYASEWRIIR